MEVRISQEEVGWMGRAIDAIKEWFNMDIYTCTFRASRIRGDKKNSRIVILIVLFSAKKNLFHNALSCGELSTGRQLREAGDRLAEKLGNPVPRTLPKNVSWSVQQQPKPLCHHQPVCQPPACLIRSGVYNYINAALLLLNHFSSTITSYYCCCCCCCCC